MVTRDVVMFARALAQTLAEFPHQSAGLLDLGLTFQPFSERNRRDFSLWPLARMSHRHELAILVGRQF
jgi:hypothetical protein